MVIKHVKAIKTTSLPVTILIVGAYLLFTMGLRIFAKSFDLPPSLAQLTIWLVLLTPFAFSRRVAYSMAFFNVLLSLTMIYKSQYSHGGPNVINPNAFLTTTVSGIMVAIIAEVTFRYRAHQIKLIAALQEARDRAERADLAKGSFLANMSHEIRTPISGIIGVIEMIRSENITPRQDELLAMAADSSDVLLNIVNNVLDYSKIEAGKLELANEPFNPSHLFEKVARNFALMAENKSIYFTSSIPDDLPEYVEGDRYRFRQILTNLISNAIKYTDSGAVSFTVTSKIVGESVSFTMAVSDTGMGIPKFAQEKLFTPFEQGDNSYRKSAQGTGLGLSITKFIIEKMNGDIMVQSHENEGSIFTIIIDFPLSNHKESLENKHRVITNHAIQGTLLLAEDNKVNQLYLVHFLEKAGFNIKLAENGAEAVELAKAQQFDAILMDIQMPIMSGIEATARIRSHEDDRSLARTPILALTASATEHDRATILSSGIDHFCPKPVDMRSLLSKLQKIIG